MSTLCSGWLGRHVVLQVEVGELRLPIRGLFVSESRDSIRLRIDGRWDFDIYKEMIVRVEADQYGSSILVTTAPSPPPDSGGWQG